MSCLLCGYVLACSIGVAAHLLYFIRGEHHTNAPAIVAIHASIAVLSLFGNQSIVGDGMGTALVPDFSYISAYAFGLFTSMLFYRAFFHRLRAFPGPFMAKMTKFWHVSKSLRSQNHLLMASLHRNYGDFVRTGRSSLSILFLCSKSFAECELEHQLPSQLCSASSLLVKN